MEKHSVQGDLFPESGAVDINRGQKKRSFFSFFFGYEKVIIISISFLLCAVVSFSLGVEHGRHIAVSIAHLNIESAAVKPLPDIAAPPGVSAVKPAVSAQKVNPLAVVEKAVIQLPTMGIRPVQKNNGRYTIQVATYKSRVNAQSEAEVLKKSGLEVKLLIKGEYSILCAGSFSDKQKAQIVLGELEKKYKGCIIRRL